MGKKVIIVGGVAAGASAAARLRRIDEEAEIIVFERGEYVSFANCGLPYYAGGVINNRSKLLVQTPQSLYRRFNIDVRVRSEVLRIVPEHKTIEVKNIPEDKVYGESYDYLVLCPGAAPIIPDIEGVDKSNVFTLRNVPDGDIIKGYINSYRPTRATVVGAGFIGLEIAEMLKLNGLDVSIIEAAPQVMGVLDYEMAAIVQDYLK
ncbi:MAG: FAD-dependent oxidoreductase, partial [Syntrophomonadaceae bacterium]|nr:FAD-dependent oxidoreductase [Syntrophomonadaceae bacterium]